MRNAHIYVCVYVCMYLNFVVIGESMNAAWQQFLFDDNNKKMSCIALEGRVNICTRVVDFILTYKNNISSIKAYPECLRPEMPIS